MLFIPIRSKTEGLNKIKYETNIPTPGSPGWLLGGAATCPLGQIAQVQLSLCESPAMGRTEMEGWGVHWQQQSNGWVPAKSECQLGISCGWRAWGEGGTEVNCPIPSSNDCSSRIEEGILNAPTGNLLSYDCNGAQNFYHISWWS